MKETFELSNTEFIVICLSVCFICLAILVRCFMITREDIRMKEYLKKFKDK